MGAPKASVILVPKGKFLLLVPARAFLRLGKRRSEKRWIKK